MANTNQTMIETGAMTLVLLVQNYKSQLIALLLKNGVVIPNGASDQQIAVLVANLLKVSKSFENDLNKFVKNPKVIEVLAGKNQQNVQYFRADGYMNMTQSEDDDNVLNTTSTNTTTPAKSGFFSNLNLGDLFGKALGAFASYDSNLTARQIARERAKLGLPVKEVLTPTEIKEKAEEDKKKKDGIGTTAIVLISVVSIALIGTIIYFVARPKK